MLILFLFFQHCLNFFISILFLLYIFVDFLTKILDMLLCDQLILSFLKRRKEFIEGLLFNRSVQ